MAEHDPPTALARDVHTKIHAVLETADQGVYLGFRVTNDLDPYSLANRGHVNALLRATSGDLLDIHHSGVVVYLEGQPARRFRLHWNGPGAGPVLTEPARRHCQCGLDLEPPPDIECWRPDLQPDPGPDVYAVAICGEFPAARRAVRCENGAGWQERGASPHWPGAGSITLAWSEIGRCSAGGLHPVRRLGL